MSTVNINGMDTELGDLKEDLLAAFELGYSQKYAFTPETVMALLAYIEELEEALTDEVQAIRYNGDWEESEQTQRLMEQHNLEVF